MKKYTVTTSRDTEEEIEAPNIQTACEKATQNYPNWKIVKAIKPERPFEPYYDEGVVL